MKELNQYSFKRIIIVAYRLPFRLVKKKGEYHAVQNSGGLVSAMLSLSERINSYASQPSKILWIGTGEKQLGTEQINPEFELYPVEIPHNINDKFYGGFCNETIWPLFHYFPTRTVYDNSYFDAYRAANTLFFQKIQGLIQPGDFIWVHDYHLFLLPGMIRSEFPDASVGFFLHIPFPSFELFRLLPRKWREAILAGIAGADVAGFHTNDYAQYFIKSVKRTLGYRIDRNFILVEDRLCKADAFPIGINYTSFHEASASQKTNVQKDKLRKSLQNNRLIFSIDRLDYSKGFLHRLKAFERFLDKYPEWHHKVVFNMIVIPSRDNIDSYREIKKEIEATVGRMNGKYSTLTWRPVVYQYKTVPFNELVAIYSLSDVALITPLRDGMNLVSKEYVACQGKHYGTLVMSEMAGAAVELNEAIFINPNDTEETADAINKALLMPEDEKKSRMLKMQNRISHYNVFTWATDFFNQIDDVKKEQVKMQVRFINSTTAGVIRAKYFEAKTRLFLIDYDGTLAPIEKQPELAVLSNETRDILQNLASNRKNKIVIISGRKMDFIDKQFRGIDVVLVAEHGYFIKHPGSEWITKFETDVSWKEKLKPVINDYVDRCSGSMMEEKNASLVWHYRNADDEIATVRINELKDDLYEILKTDPKLQILEGDKVLEIKSILYDKGTAAASIMGNDTFDFIIALGDDNTDEDLFKIVPENGFSIKVGNRISNARYYIREQGLVNYFLQNFVEPT